MLVTLRRGAYAAAGRSTWGSTGIFVDIVWIFLFPLLYLAS